MTNIKKIDSYLSQIISNQGIGVSYSPTGKAEYTAQLDLPAKKLEGVTQDLARLKNKNASTGFIEMMADLTLNANDFGVPVVLNTLDKLYDHNWNYFPALGRYAERLLSNSKDALVGPSIDKIEDRRWMYDNFLVNHLDDISESTSMKLATFFSKAHQPT